MSGDSRKDLIGQILQVIVATIFGIVIQQILTYAMLPLWSLIVVLGVYALCSVIWITRKTLIHWSKSACHKMNKGLQSIRSRSKVPVKESIKFIYKLKSEDAIGPGIMFGIFQLEITMMEKTSLLGMHLEIEQVENNQCWLVGKIDLGVEGCCRLLVTVPQGTSAHVLNLMNSENLEYSKNWEMQNIKPNQPLKYFLYASDFPVRNNMSYFKDGNKFKLSLRFDGEIKVIYCTIRAIM